MAHVQTRPADVETYSFGADEGIPNNPLLPLVVYRGVLSLDGEAAGKCEALFARHEWRGAWRNGIYGYHHFHTTAHEVLGIVRGSARVAFGGPNGRTLEVSAGDVVVIPAGVGHKNEGASADLLVVGAYPTGQEWDICPARPGERDCAQQDIGRVPLPQADPVYGAQGPLVRHWRAAAGSAP